MSYEVLLARLRSGCVELWNNLFTIYKRNYPLRDYCANVRETVEHYVLRCQIFNDIRMISFNEFIVLNKSPDSIDLKTLLDGGDGPYKLKLNILNLFMEFIKELRRFDN